MVALKHTAITLLPTLLQDEESELAARLDKMTPEEIDDLY
jgi:hypothetical protein